MVTSRQEVESGQGDLDISNVIAAFSEDQVQGITGLSKGRLRYWAKTQFFMPSFVEDGPSKPYSRFYSFKDLVALRTLEMLRVQNHVPLQHLRLVADKLIHLGDDLWTRTTLFVFNRRVVLVHPGTDVPEEVVLGQYLLDIPLEKVIHDTKQDVENLRRRPPGSIGQIRRTRAIVRNAWTIAGTRIPVGAIRRLHEDGYSITQIISEYPDLTSKDVEEALKHDEKMAV